MGGVQESSTARAVSLTHLYVTRIEQTDYATYGHLSDDEGRVFTVTLEPPEPKCIPCGTYQFYRRKSHLDGGTGKHDYDVFELSNVPGRDAIELHIGNVVADTDGCVCVGQSFGTVEGQHGIINSKVAFDRFMATMHGIDSGTLTVVDATTEAPDL